MKTMKRPALSLAHYLGDEALLNNRDTRLITRAEVGKAVAFVYACAKSARRKGAWMNV